MFQKMVCLALGMGSLVATANQAPPRGRTDYYEGLPPVYYRGELCSQSSSQVSHGSTTPNVSVTCYDATFSPRRQCNFSWSRHTHTAAFSIATYAHYRSGGFDVTDQSNTSIKTRSLVQFAQVPQLASDWINQYCGAPIPNQQVRRYEKQDGIQLRNGMGCDYVQYSNPPRPVDSKSLTCHDHSRSPESLQCGVNTGTRGAWPFRRPALEVYINRYGRFSHSGGRDNGSHQNHIVRTSVSWDGNNFQDRALEWLNSNCRW